jgi:hypothetical protein
MLSFGVVTSGSNTTCNLLFKLNNLLEKEKIQLRIPFVVMNDFHHNGKYIEKHLNTKVCHIENDNSKYREEIYQNHLKEITPYPIKKILFIEYENTIPYCYKTIYDCFILLPSVNRRFGTWENILGETITTRNDHCGCSIVKYVNNDLMPFVYHAMITKNFDWKEKLIKTNVLKSNLFYSLKEAVLENMLYTTLLFFHILTDKAYDIKENIIFMNDIPILGGVNAEIYVREMKKRYGSSN